MEKEVKDAMMLGKIAFNAYRESKNGVTYDGKVIPPWEAVSEDVQKGWAAAAMAAIAASDAASTVIAASAGADRITRVHVSYAYESDGKQYISSAVMSFRREEVGDEAWIERVRSILSRDTAIVEERDPARIAKTMTILSWQKLKDIGL